MPYAAVWTKDGKTIIKSQKYARVFTKYNRTLWNWLYGNITEPESTVPGEAPKVAERKVLYADVMLPEYRWNLYMAITKACFWVKADSTK